MSEPPRGVADGLRDARIGSALPVAVVVFIALFTAGLATSDILGQGHYADAVVIGAVELTVLCLLSLEAMASIVRGVRPALFCLIWAFVAWRFAALWLPRPSGGAALEFLAQGLILTLPAGVAWLSRRRGIPPARPWRTAVLRCEQAIALVVIAMGLVFFIQFAARASRSEYVALYDVADVDDRPRIRVQVGDSVAPSGNDHANAPGSVEKPPDTAGPEGASR